MYYYVELIQSTTIKVIIEVDKVDDLYEGICKVANQYFYGMHSRYFDFEGGCLLTNNVICFYKRADSFHSFPAQKGDNTDDKDRRI